MSVTIRECPHCYSRVGFLADGVCPACRKRVSDVGADPTMTLFTASRSSSVPPVCIGCGENTNRRVVISKGTRSRLAGVLAAVGTILGYCLAPILRGGAIGIIYAQDRKKHPHARVRLSIPLCSKCQSTHGIPEPHRVDFDKATMSFLVTREVATKLTQKT